MNFNEEARYYGAKLCLMRSRSFESPSAFASASICTRLLDAVTSGARIVTPLWMSLFTAKTGKRLPNGNRDIFYVPFWKPEKHRMYRFLMGYNDINSMYPDSIQVKTGTDKPKRWSMHSF